jgi:hypothetical protein
MNYRDLQLISFESLDPSTWRKIWTWTNPVFDCMKQNGQLTAAQIIFKMSQFKDSTTQVHRERERDRERWSN